jgi:uncharacterized membrane protein
MEICILKFDGKRSADDALEEVSDARANRMPWLNEVGVVSRPIIGRLTVRANYPDGETLLYKEGELAGKAGDIGAYTGYLLGNVSGPLRASLLALEASTEAGDRVASVEKKLFHIDELKELLPRDSSALVLVADTSTCDDMVAAFSEYDPQIIRRNVATELQKRLSTIRDQSLQQLSP